MYYITEKTRSKKKEIIEKGQADIVRVEGRSLRHTGNIIRRYSVGYTSEK